MQPQYNNCPFSSRPFFQATLTILDKLDIETEFPTEEEIARKFGWEEDYHSNGLSLWQRTKPKIFSLFDEPHSSTCARVRRCGKNPR
jgi:potassium voltage-gated channel Shaw-related subfamily C protein 1